MTEQNAPACIGIIMDGNRRWAREHGLPQLVGHQKGLEKMKEVVDWALEAGVGTIILYAFSTENWKRAEEEVSYLMKLSVQALDNELKEVQAKGVRVRFIGDLAQLPREVRERAERMQEEKKAAQGGTVAFALSYGSRAEIAEATNRLIAKGAQSVTEESFRAALPSADLPDPDLIIRTGGERRLSNFLLYQAAYSELAFVDTKWPGFSREEFDTILQDFSTRDRRHGR